MDISVVTASYNSAKTILKTIESVQAAKGEWKIQQVFVDGGSTDGTIKLIQKHKRKHDIVISEPDDGISDAFNKGISAAKGKYIHILNSDDWAELDFWDILLKSSENFTVPILHSDLNLISNGKLYKKAYGRINYTDNLDVSMRGIMHPSTIVHREIFDKVGVFLKELKYAMDLEWFQRAYDNGVVSKYIPGAFVNFSAGQGQSFKDFGIIREGTILARQRGVHKIQIYKMQYSLLIRLLFHKQYATIKTLLK